MTKVDGILKSGTRSFRNVHGVWLRVQVEVTVVLARRNVIMVSYPHRVLIVLWPHVDVKDSNTYGCSVDSDVCATILVAHAVRGVGVTWFRVSRNNSRGSTSTACTLSMPTCRTIGESHIRSGPP